MAAGQLEGPLHNDGALAALLMALLGARMLAGLMQPVAGLAACVGQVLPVIHMACPVHNISSLKHGEACDTTRNAGFPSENRSPPGC